MVLYRGGTGDGTFTHGTDTQSRMTSIVKGSGNVAAYAFDPLGWRKSKTTMTSPGNDTTICVDDADGRDVLEYNGTTGATNAWYARPL